LTLTSNPCCSCRPTKAEAGAITGSDRHAIDVELAGTVHRADCLSIGLATAPSVGTIHRTEPGAIAWRRCEFAAVAQAVAHAESFAVAVAGINLQLGTGLLAGVRLSVAVSGECDRRDCSHERNQRQSGECLAEHLLLLLREVLEPGGSLYPHIESNRCERPTGARAKIR
jgi:hypothetical protein